MNTIALYFLLFIGFSCVFIGFYLKYAPQPRLDWNEQFIIFLNEKGVLWLYESELNMGDDPEEFVVKMTSYNGESTYWRRTNAEWLTRVEEIGEGSNK